MVQLDKLSHESIWFAVTTAAAAGFQFIAGSAQPTDIKAYLLALGIAMARPVFALLAGFAAPSSVKLPPASPLA